MAKAALDAILEHVVRGRRPSKWVARERPKIDRIAHPWAVLRFVDPSVLIVYAPAHDGLGGAAREGAVAFAVPGASIAHEGALCGVDVLLQRFGLDDPALAVLAPIIRGGDTNRHELAPEAAILHAISLGLGFDHGGDPAPLPRGLLLHGALRTWAKHARGERQDWRPESIA